MTVYRAKGIELRLGDWREVLQDVEPDAVITDPPYSARTHAGHNDATDQTRSITGQLTRAELSYGCMAQDEIGAFASEWMRRARGWIALMNSHDAIPAFERAAGDAGRYHFAPVPIIQKRPRLLGDGPASWAVYLLVARRRTQEAARWGCLPGAYFSTTDRTGIVAGAKPLPLMREIVRDYSRPGDLVCDPCAGGGTTLIAAAMEGREAIGAEIDPETFERACARIDGTAITPPLLVEQAPPAHQLDLLGEGKV